MLYFEHPASPPYLAALFPASGRPADNWFYQLTEQLALKYGYFKWRSRHPEFCHRYR
jgi:hypothetical protein